MCNIKISKCCCCVDLKLGAIIIAVAEIILYLIGGIYAFVVGNVVGGIVNLIRIIPGICLLIGARDEKNGGRCLILVWLVVHGIFLILSLIALVVSVILFIIALSTDDAFDDWETSEWYSEMDWNASIATLFGIALASILVIVVVYLHLYLVVLSLYRERAETPTAEQVDPNAYPYPSPAVAPAAATSTDTVVPMSTVDLD